MPYKNCEETENESGCRKNEDNIPETRKALDKIPQGTRKRGSPQLSLAKNCRERGITNCKILV